MAEAPKSPSLSATEAGFAARGTHSLLAAGSRQPIPVAVHRRGRSHDRVRHWGIIELVRFLSPHRGPLQRRPRPWRYLLLQNDLVARQIHLEELIWIIVAFLWGLVMFFMMIYWHIVGRQNLSNETYRTTPRPSPPRPTR